MDNKLSELSKPVMYSLRFRNMHTGEPDKNINANTTFSTLEKAKAYGLGTRYVTQDDGKIVSVRDPSQDPIVEPLYSQEYVSALEKVAQYWVGQSYEWKQHAEAVEKRIAGLESEITNVIGNHAKSATEPRVLLAKLGLLPDEIDDFALQVIGINKKNIYIPKPIFIPQEDIRVYLNADILITCLEKQDLILSHY